MYSGYRRDCNYVYIFIIILEQYKHKVFHSTNEIVDFLNQKDIPKENIITILLINTEPFLLYELIYTESLI